MLRTVVAASLAAIAVNANGQGIPTPGHKCVYNCDAPSAPSSPGTTGWGAQMGSTLGAAIVRSLANQRQQEQQRQEQARVPDPAQTEAARQSLDNWANGGSPAASPSAYTPRPQVTYEPNSPESQLDRWANEVRDEDLRDSLNAARKRPKTKPAQHQAEPKPTPVAKAQVPTVPKECDAWFEDPPQSALWFFQCKPQGGERYCLQTLADGQLQEVPCNTQSR